MIRDIEQHIRTIEGLLAHIRVYLEADKTIGITKELVDALNGFDEIYKEYCEGIDETNNEEPGTTYNNPYGPNIEFYIEADDWHRVSLALRELNKSA